MHLSLASPWGQSLGLQPGVYVGKYNDIDGILGKSLTLFDERFLGGWGGGEIHKSGNYRVVNGIIYAGGWKCGILVMRK